MSWLDDLSAERRKAEEAEADAAANQHEALERRRALALQCLRHGEAIAPFVRRTLAEFAAEYWGLSSWDRLWRAGRPTEESMSPRDCHRQQWSDSDLTPLFSWTVDHFVGSRPKGEFRLMLIQSGGPPWRFRLLFALEQELITADTSEEELKRALRQAFIAGPRHPLYSSRAPIALKNEGISGD